MLPIRWDPFKEFGLLPRDLDNLIRQTFGGSATETGSSEMMLAPVVNTFIRDNVFCLQAELPGVAKEDLDISIENDLLVIKGERKETKEKEDRNYMVKESRYGSFVRKVTLPEGVNIDKVHAVCEEGVLEITMPIEMKETAARKIVVEGKEGKKEHKIH